MQLRIYTHAHEIWSLEQFTEVKAAQLGKWKTKISSCIGSHGGEMGDKGT